MSEMVVLVGCSSREWFTMKNKVSERGTYQRLLNLLTGDRLMNIVTSLRATTT
ncbi:MAG: hypothetical protein N2V73_05930 [Candidatus Methanospirare jalkutatii]|nr:hypothetical protein [Candidatus Methanospirare jalkutatii]